MSSLFLIGFMAAGKSQVAQALGARLGLPVSDLDQCIERDANCSIAEIFQQEGEAGFRKRESLALAQAIAGPTAIIATGGGAPFYSDNFSKMEFSGTVIHLAVDLATAKERARKQKTKRPLLLAPDADIEELYRGRMPAYRRAHLTVSTEAKSPQAVTDAIVDALAASDRLPAPWKHHATTVSLGSRSYSVVTQADCLDTIGDAVATALPSVKTVGLISDTNVAPLYQARLLQSLKAASFRVVSATIAPGETSKTISTYNDLSETLISGGLDRSSAVLALGGGVVGDLAGFVASSLFRGIPIVQIPTSLLAMTDSAIGGKTGINSRSGKNLIGAFWQPALVCIDPMTLQTLPLRERVAAFGELVKYALLDREIWPLVARLASEVASKELVIGESFTLLIKKCAALKAAVVSEDERERGLRATLNLGHTVGHAIEMAAGYGTILHGEAVALGLLAACHVSHRLGFCQASLQKEVRQILQDAGLQTDLKPYLNETVLAHMGVDKKRTGSCVRFLVVAQPGDVRRHSIELSALRRLLTD